MIAAIYIEQYEDLINTPQTINLGGKYLYEFKKEGEDTIIVSRTINEQYVEGFFDISGSGCKVDLVTAIVGENGVGKTRLMGAFTYYTTRIDTLKTLVIICEDINHNCYYVNSKLKSILFKNDDNRINEMDKDSQLYREFNFLYYTNYFKDRDFYLRDSQYDSFIDIDDISFYNSHSISFDNDVITIGELFFEQFLRQVELLNSELFTKKLAPKIYENTIPNYHYVKIDFNRLNRLSSKLKEDLDILYQYFNIQFSDTLSNNLLEKINKQLLISIICSLIFNNKCSLSIENLNNLDSYEDIFFKILETALSDKDILDAKEHYNNFYGSMSKLYSIINKNIHISLSEIKDNFHRINNMIISLSHYQEFLLIYKKFFNSIYALFSEIDLIDDNYLIKKYGMLSFKAGHNLSGGEEAIINFYSLLKNYINKNIDKVRKTVILLLDEADLGFHPTWKKKYVKILLETIPHFFPKETKLQIIFTTHDPLTLSDMPNNNVVFLKKDDNGKTIVLNNEDKARPRKTFGANITDILSNAFFVEDGLIGEFAKDKINATIDWINKQKEAIAINKHHIVDKAELEKHRRIVNMIDEPVIRRKLQEMLQDLAPEDKVQKIDDEMNELRKRMEALKAQKSLLNKKKKK